MDQDSNLINAREKRILEAFHFNLLSDVFMSVALADKDACQYVLRILTGVKDLIVQEVRTQYTISKIISKGAKLDVLAVDGKGKIYNIEIQRRSTIDHGKRVRFYSSMVDSEFLQKGKEYHELPDVYIIYISEEDIWKAGRTMYSVVKSFEDTNIGYEDGVKVLYVNAAVDDGSDIARLMNYFSKADPNDSSQGELSKRIHFLKCEEGGYDIMCEVIDRFIEMGREEGRAEGRKEEKLDMVKVSIKKGLPIELIAELTGLTIQEIENLIDSKED